MDNIDDGEDFAGESSAERIIRLTGDISEETAEKFILNLKKVAEIPGEIIVIVSSEGGDIEEGLRIIDALNIARNRGCPVHTVASGKAYSMASLIVCTGDTRTMYPHTRLMFHSGRYEEFEDGKSLTVPELEKMRDEMSMFNGIFRDILLNVGMPQQIIDRIMVDDVYMNAGEALSLGVINSIETEII